MDRRPIGVMDSGIGGLTVVKILRERYPKESFIFIGDKARNPYGERSGEEILRFSEEMKSYLLSRDVKMIWIACNTISFTVPPSFYESGTPVSGMRPDLDLPKGAVHVAVFATPVTIGKHLHREVLRTQYPQLAVTEVPCEGLAHAIEIGESEASVEERIRRLVKRYGVADADTAILACTHYPLVTHLFRRELSHAVFVDPAEAAVEWGMGILKEKNLLSDEKGMDEAYFTAEAEQAEPLVRKLFGSSVIVKNIKVAKE